MNPGEDSGLTVNIVLETFAKDVINYINDNFLEVISSKIDNIIAAVLGPKLEANILVGTFRACKPEDL